MKTHATAGAVAAAGAVATLCSVAEAQVQYSLAPGQGTAAQSPAEGTDESGWFAGRRGFAAKLSIGPTYRRLFFSNILAADAEYSLGAQTSVGGIYGTLGGMYGSTLEGLWVGQSFVGATWEAPVMDKLHVGGGPRFSYLAIKRATTGNMMDDFGIGLWAFGSYDVFADEEGAVFVSLRAGGDYNVGGDDWPPPLLFGATLSLGVRLY
jgi:hypothetical protein